jgi:hypothetical protein
MAKVGAVTRYSCCLEVDNGDDTRTPSVSEWKRGEGAGALRDGRGAVMVRPIVEGRKREVGGRLLLRAEREGGRNEPKWLFHLVFPFPRFVMYLF